MLVLQLSPRRPLIHMLGLVPERTTKTTMGTNSQCSEVLTLYQKNPLSTNKPPCLNVYFKMKIKLKAFVLNAQIPLPFLNSLSWKTPLNFVTKPSVVISKQFPSTQTGFSRSFLHCRIVREDFFQRGWREVNDIIGFKEGKYFTVSAAPLWDNLHFWKLLF